MINNDFELVQELLKHDEVVTREFFYKKCYPLFKSVYDNYHTDCSSCIEFINEIYIHLLSPNKKTGICKLEQFKFQSTLFTWLKTVCLFYCYKRYKRKINIIETYCENSDMGVRNDVEYGSIEIDGASLNNCDMETILQLMPNRRYSYLIRLRYIEGHSNEETAQIMGMNMNTFYNKHKMAKEQFVKILRKEENYYG